MAISQIELQYKYSGKGPVDAKSLVKTYAELLDPTTWYNSSDKSTAYNGMIVAVGLDSDANKNGVYILHDEAVTNVLKTPDVTNTSNWHKVASLAELESISNVVETLADSVTMLAATANSNADKLAGIDNTVTDYVASIINSVVMPKASSEVTIADDGTLGIGEISTDKLVQGAKTIVLSGGTAAY